MPIDEGFVPSRGSTVHAVEIDGEAVLLDETSGRLHLLNTTGALVWSCFDGSASLAEIFDDVSDAFGVSRERVAVDSLAIVRRLVAEGLLTDAGAESAEGR
jgi:chromosome condensin MukBEF complex kleisin-like MukF subunit